MSAIYTRSANGGTRSVVSGKRGADGAAPSNNKKPQDLATLRLLNLRTYARLIFHFDVLNYAGLARAGVIHLHAVLRR
jgi:hypothetical protein